MKISGADQLKKFLKEIASMAVEDAMRNRADHEKDIQRDVQQDVQAATGGVQGREKPEGEVAAAKDLFKDEEPKGAPKRQPGEEPGDEEKGGIEVAQDGESGDQGPTDGAPSPEGGEEGEIRAEDITLDTVVDKINIIRAGKSMKDSDVSSQMETYVKGLDDAEKIALYGFLKGIGQIVGADVEAASTQDPGEEPYSVMMQRVKGLEKQRMTQKHHDKKAQQEPGSQKGDVPVQRHIESKPEPERRKRRDKDHEDTAPPIRAGRRESVEHDKRLLGLLK